MTEKSRYQKLKLKTVIRTDEAYLIDLGEGKVWIPKSAIKSTRRVASGVLEIEVLREAIEEKRLQMRRLKVKVTGVKGSVLGEVEEVTGEIIKEAEDALWIRFNGNDLYIPKVCFSEIESLPEGKTRFIIQKDFLDYKLRQMKKGPSEEAQTTVQVEILRETDRAYLLAYQGIEIWFPKREIIEIKELPEGGSEIIVPTDFWTFKLRQ